MAHNTPQVAVKRCADPRYYNGPLHDSFVQILAREGLANPASHFSLAEFGGLAQFVDEALRDGLQTELEIAASHGTNKLVAVGHEDCARIKDLLGANYSVAAERELLTSAAKKGAELCKALRYQSLRAYYQTLGGEVFLYDEKRGQFVN